ncbi:hypothetical protein TRFO_36010 [Tritrichomonas foetus]|uniref:Uncharacterized protein n=1 Tax=Tritrichomonas foetus TaxID=1144522 RepID=A0A1J4JF03_9EUKA|nr:hypothetical protein TRFO_36010 [Tritrichomonas foetus]|eukprot:OHS97722.1 hypothetical protein TRFO_36010 [Tritrichomonas foetus]
MSQQQNNKPSQEQQHNPDDFASMIDQFLPFVEMFAQFFNQQTPNQPQSSQNQPNHTEQAPANESTQSSSNHENHQTNQQQNSYPNFPFFFPFNMIGTMFNPQCWGSNNSQFGQSQPSTPNQEEQTDQKEQTNSCDPNEKFFDPLFDVLNQLFNEDNNNENSSLLQDIISQIIDPSMYYGNAEQQNSLNLCSIFEVLKDIYPQLNQYNMASILAQFPHISQRITNLFTDAFRTQMPHHPFHTSNTQSSNDPTGHHCQNQNHQTGNHHHCFWHTFFNNLPNEVNNIVAEEHRERITEFDGTVRIITKRSLGEKWYQCERTMKDQSSIKEIWHNIPEDEYESFKAAWKAQFDKQN